MGRIESEGIMANSIMDIGEDKDIRIKYMVNNRADWVKWLY